MKIISPVLSALLLILVQPASARQVVDAKLADRGRIAPPAGLACDRNQLTSYNGQVTHYQRDETATFITIETEWGTQESISISHRAPEGAQSHFLLNGQDFPAGGWQAIESEPGVLLAGMRVIAWVCGDGETQPVADWRPE